MDTTQVYRMDNSQSPKLILNYKSSNKRPLGRQQKRRTEQLNMLMEHIQMQQVNKL